MGPYHFPLSSRFSLPPVSPILPSPILPSLPPSRLSHPPISPILPSLPYHFPLPSRFSHPPVSPLSLSPFLPFSLPLVSHSLVSHSPVSHPLVPSLFGSRNGLATDQLNRKVLAKTKNR